MKTRTQSRFLLLILVAAMMNSINWALPALASTTSPSIANAVVSLRQCIDQYHQLDLVALVDESGSLATTDPANNRSRALKEALQELALNASTQSEVNRISLVGFATTAKVTQDWTTLTSQSLPTLLDAVNRTSIVRTGADGNTNFPAGLKAALSQFGLLDSGPAACRAVVWFTDGRLDISGAGTGMAPADLAGKAAICNPGGLADQLVENNVWTFAVGLSDSGGMDPAAQAALQSYVSGPPGTCGSQATNQTGAFFSVSRAGNLFFALQSIGDPGAVLSPTPVVTCAQLTGCGSEGTLWVDSTVASFRISAVSASPQDAWTMVLTDPSGHSATLTPGAPVQSLDGVPLSVASFDHRFQLDVTGATEGVATSSGKWTFQFIDAAHPGIPVQFAVSLSPAFQAKVLTPSSFSRDGKLVTGSIGLVDYLSGKTLSNVVTQSVSASVGNSSSSVAASPQALALTPQGGSQWSFAFSDKFSDNLIRVVIAGVALVGPEKEPMWFTNSQLIANVLPSNYPVVSLAGLSGSVLSPGSPLTIFLRIHTRSVGGCVAFNSARNVSSPSAFQSRVRPSFPSTKSACLNLAPHSQRSTSIIEVASRPANGFVNQRISFWVRGSNDSNWRLASVIVAFNSHKPVNVVHALIRFLLLIGVGVLTPYLVLVLFRRHMVRFEGLDAIRFLSHSMKIAEGGAPSALDNQSGSITPPPPNATVSALGAGGDDREFGIDGLTFSLKSTGGFSNYLRSLVQWPSVAVRSDAPFAVWNPSTETVSDYDTKSKLAPNSLINVWIIRGLSRSLAVNTFDAESAEVVPTFRFSWMMFMGDNALELDRHLSDAVSKVGEVLNEKAKMWMPAQEEPTTVESSSEPSPSAEAPGSTMFGDL
jgi:von Willebrand factor type A domain